MASSVRAVLFFVGRVFLHETEHKAMILDTAYLVDDKNTDGVLPEKTRSISLLQMEVQDSLHEIIDALHQQSQPVLLLLPASGDAFSQSDHFRALRSFLLKREQPLFLCLIIPSERTKEATLATHYGIEHTSSLEEALQSLVHFSHRDETLARPSSPLMQTRNRQITETLPKMDTSSFQNAPSPTRTRPYLLSAGVGIALLLLASVIVIPLLLLPTHVTAPLSSTAATPPGTLTFTSSGQFDPNTTQGYNDIITLSFRALPAPPIGMVYDVWLLPDAGDDITPPLLMGSLHAAGPVRLIYTSPDHTNLLASYSGVRVTVEANTTTPDTPSQNPADWRWQGFIPNTPTPGDENHYALLSHVRHLLAKDPTLQANQIPGGLAIWLTRNVAKVEEWASAAQGDWHGAQTDTDQIHNHMLRILEYLDGAFYYTRDVPAGSPWLVDPQAGKIGLLNSIPNQSPPGFLAHLDIHLTGLAGAPGHTIQQQHLAVLVDTVIMRMRTDLQQVRTDAANLVKMTAQQLQQQDNDALLNEMVTLTTEVKSGWFDPQTGENIGGVLWITSRLQQLTTIALNRL